MRAQLTAATVVALLLAVACESPPGPTTGAVRLSVTSTGGDLDLDGYNAGLDGGQPQPVPVNGSVVFPGVPTGAHLLALNGVASNCVVIGGISRSATVTGGDTTNVAFAVACVATGVRITTATTGLDLDSDGYAIGVDGVLVTVLGVNGVGEITRLTAGSHMVTLTAVAANCAVGGEHPRPVNIAALGDIVPLTFAVSCVAVTGVIEVTTATTGLDLDPNGYTVQVDGGSPQALPTNGTTRLPGFAAGNHSVTVAGAAGNCAVGGANPRTVTVTVGSTTRDTARTTFDASCVAATGVIEVTTATSGVEQDPNGYSVKVDDGVPQSVGNAGTIRFPGLAGGGHSVTLTGAAANCSAAGDNPRTVMVTVGGATRDTARTTFDVTCVSTTGSLHIAASTSGAEFDPNGYRVFVDEVCDYGYYYGYYCYYLWDLPLGVNGETTITPIPTGAHTVWISDVARNCTVAAGNPRTATVPPAATADVVFSVSCVQTGSVQLSAVTTGVDADVDGYQVRLHGAAVDTIATVGPNATVTVPGLPPGNYGLTYSGVTLNCDVSSPGPGSVTVASGASVPASMSVACGAARQLAFVFNNQIYKMKANGAGLTQLTADPFSHETPVWSSDGSKIVFSAYPQPSGNAEIYKMNADGTGQVRLTTNAVADYRPSWSPDGQRIVFVSTRDGGPEIYVMNADGQNVTRLTNNTAMEGDPVWSPVDATKIAFTSNRAGVGHAAIYVMDSSGANVTQVTPTPSAGDDMKPTWSPDGTRIAFGRVASCDYYYCERDLWVINAGGDGLAQLTSGYDDHGDPAWSPDGNWIAFNAGQCYYGCSAWIIKAVRSNGTDIRDVLGPTAYHPTWGP